MKFSNQLNQRSFGKWIVALLLTIGFMACSPAPTTPEPDNDPDPTISGYATDKVIHTHTKGQDTCPQEIEQKAEVYCFKGQKFNSCDADSVVITGSSPGVTAKFAGSKTTSQTFTQSSSPEIRQICFTFTCSIAKSFKHTYTLEFYKDGKKVDTEDVLVDVTVIE